VGAGVGVTPRYRNLEPMQIFFTDQRLERIRVRLQTDAAFQARWDRLRARGAELMALPWPTETQAATADGQVFNFRAPAQHLSAAVKTLSLLHAIEPDERYAKKIRSGLLYYADEYEPYSQWCSPMFRERVPAWNSELVTGNLCLSYSLGYELLRDALSSDDRQRITTALTEKGVRPLLKDWLFPDSRIHSLDTMGHNWWIVCISLAGIGAITVYDEVPEVAAWLRQIDEAIPQWFGYGGNLFDNRVANFDSNGGYYEGVHYANYAIMEYLLYRTALNDRFDGIASPAAPELRKVENFFLHTFYPASDGDLVVNFGDTRNNPHATMSMLLLAATGIAGGHAQWVANRTAGIRAEPLAMLLDADIPATPPDDVPTSALFPDAGWAVLRSSWSDDATLLAVRSGTYWIHAHADSGSFILFHRGRPLIIDPGHCEYFHPEYTSYYAASDAHNVVLVNHTGAPPEDFCRGSKFPGKLHSLLDEGGFRYICADAAGPMAHLLKRHYRHWIWVDGEIVIFDDILSHEPATFQWLLHYAGSAEWHSGGARIRNVDAEASVNFLYPQEMDVREVECPAPDHVERTTTYLEFSTTEPSRKQNFVAVVSPHSGSGQRVRPIEPIITEQILGLRFGEAETITNIYFNRSADGRDACANSALSFDGWVSDAKLLAVTTDVNQPDTASRILMIGGSTLRRGGRVILDSLSSVNCIVAKENGVLNVALEGQRDIAFHVHSETEPDGAMLNGRTAGISYDTARQLAVFERSRGLQTPTPELSGFATP